MTTAAAGTAGASPASPTGNSKGAATTASPTAETTTKDVGRSAIVARVAELNAGKPGTNDADVDQGDAADGQEAQGDADAQGDKSKDDKGKKTEERMIPERALKDRLAREKKKLDGLRDQIAGKDLEHAKTREALDLALAEVDRLTAALKSGAKFDEKDEQLRAHEIANEANARAQKAQKAHETALQKARDDARRSEMAEQISEEIDGAISATDGLVHRRELIEAMKRRDNLNRSAKEVADELVQTKLERAKSRLVTPQPPTPSTVRPQSAGSNPAPRYPNNREGIRARVAAIRASG